mmetsp:Transcript_15842/g.49544  ORF Transcript_15842/g.49544 Transcript_15842/m.49544 type:complete len:301 (+) Transcript_15842:1435-2337(+)
MGKTTSDVAAASSVSSVRGRSGAAKSSICFCSENCSTSVVALVRSAALKKVTSCRGPRDARAATAAASSSGLTRRGPVSGQSTKARRKSQCSTSSACSSVTTVPGVDARSLSQAVVGAVSAAFASAPRRPPSQTKAKPGCATPIASDEYSTFVDNLVQDHASMVSGGVVAGEFGLNRTAVQPSNHSSVVVGTDTIGDAVDSLVTNASQLAIPVVAASQPTTSCTSSSARSHPPRSAVTRRPSMEVTSPPARARASNSRPTAESSDTMVPAPLDGPVALRLASVDVSDERVCTLAVRDRIE